MLKEAGNFSFHALSYAEHLFDIRRGKGLLIERLPVEARGHGGFRPSAHERAGNGELEAQAHVC
ncbi:MAG TPA: hypothetical protein VI935_02790 [Thermodesulfobacteriota bacterium]|nr:hypothetical protein [Thermodesulfobacteriota bacterium]